LYLYFIFFITHRPPISTLFPYTTLFRSVVAFRRLSRMPGLLSCRHRSRDGVQRNRVRFNLIDQGSSLAGEHPSAVGRSRHTLARPKDAHSLRSVMVGGSVRPRTLERRVSSARPARSSSGE